MELVKYLEEDFNAAGKKQTGSTYSWWARRFIGALEDKGWTIATMPANAAEDFLSKTTNPITHNVGVTGLTSFLSSLERRGVKFEPQPMTRMKIVRKKKTPAPPAGAPMSAAPLDNPFVSPFQTAPSAAPVQAVAMQPASQPTQVVMQPRPSQPVQSHAQPQHQQEAFRSLGRRVRISKLSGSNDYGVAPGQPFVIGVYDKFQIEAEGSLENFIMFRLRPSVGPKPGEPPVVYRAENLDTSGRPLQGQFWDVPIVADPLASRDAAGSTPQIVVQPPANAGGASERMLEFAFAQQKEAQARYDALQRQLLEKRDAGKLDDATLMLLLERNKPAPLDPEALKRMIKEEMAAAAPPPPPALPQMPMGMGGFGGGLFDTQPPRTDPAIDRLAALMEKQSDMMNQITMRLMTPPPAAPQKDPMELAMAMVTMMQANTKSDPIKDELAKLTIAQIANPAKSKTLQETLGDLAAIREFTAPPERGDSFLDKVVDLFSVVAENGDKVGEMLANIKGGAIRAALQPRPPQPQPQQLPAQSAVQTPPQQPQAPQPIQLPEPAKDAVRAMSRLFEGGAREVTQDASYVECLVALLQALHGAGEPWAPVAMKAIDLYKAANNKAEVQGTILNLFRWIRVKVNGTEFTDHLTLVLHRNYPEIYSLLSGGEQKTLADLGATTPPAGSTPPPSLTVVAPPPADASEEDEEEAEGEGEEEAEIEHVAAPSMPEPSAAPK